jgi:putative aminopeptidase FrvX
MIDARSIQFLEELSNSFGPSGFERDAARVLKAYVEPFSDEIITDKLGSLLFKKRGEADAPVVFLPGHIDEVGFVVSGIGKEGFLSFNQVGGWFDQVLLSQRVLVRTTKGLLPGVVAAKPPHLLTQEERAKVVKKDNMFIDIGASNEDEAKDMGVRVGDPIVPDSRFSVATKPVFEDGKKTGEMRLAVGKGFDDRIGAFVAAEVIRALREEAVAHPNTVIGGGTVQEEVGLRGARTAAWVVRPDVCLTLEVDISGDIPGIEAHKALTKMGKGPTILTFDGSMIPNQPLKELVIATAEEAKIPYQLSQMSRGGTDAGMIHISYAGCPSVVLGVPTRHIHSHVGILSLQDAENCVRLVVEVIKKLDSERVASLTAL